MKSIKYLMLAFVIGLLSTSCEKKIVDFNWEKADYSKAFVQVYYMSLVKNNSDNYIEYVTVNGQEYQYDHNAIISPYNFTPAYTVGASYQTEPGVCRIKLEAEEDSVVKDPVTKETLKNWNETGDSIKYYNRHTVYEGATEVALEAGKLYQVIVWDNDGAAPVVHEFGDIPTYTELDSLCVSRWSSFRFYNFMFDAPGVPTTAKLYFDVRAKSNGDIIGSYPEGGLAFGEATGYIDYWCKEEQIINAYNDVYLRHDIRAVWPDGTETVLLKNDYWTTRPGRSYHYFYNGSYDGQIRSKTLTRFTAK